MDRLYRYIDKLSESSAGNSATLKCGARSGSDKANVLASGYKKKRVACDGGDGGDGGDDYDSDDIENDVL
jgi:hypothetical protein